MRTYLRLPAFLALLAAAACGTADPATHPMPIATGQPSSPIVASPITCYSNPFRYMTPADETFGCIGIAANNVSACSQVTDPNQNRLCEAMATRTQSACWAITDSNLMNACLAMSVRDFGDHSSSCWTISDFGMRSFCQAVSSRNPTACGAISDPNTKRLCNAMAQSNPSWCPAISDANDQAFCQGVVSKNPAACAVPAPTPAYNGIDYHGGSVLKYGASIHFVYYGSWSDSDRLILDDFARSVGGSPYFNINSTYYDTTAGSIQNAAFFFGGVDDGYSQGVSLTDANVQQVVRQHAYRDPNGIWFVLASSDVEATDLCTRTCGWHGHTTLADGSAVRYAFIGNSARCPNACAATWVGAPPNGSVAADGMANIVAHELDEAVTDPDLNAWYDGSGAENADKCAWTFGTTYPTPNGGRANVHLGARDFLIQQNWVNARGGYCALSY